MQRGIGITVFGQSFSRGFNISLGRYTSLPDQNLQFSWPVSMKFKRLSDQSKKLIFALIVEQSWKPFRLLQHPPCYKSDISNCHSVRLIYVPENSSAGGNQIAYVFTRDSSTKQFAGPEVTMQISRQTITHNIMCWLFNQHMTLQQMYQHSDRQSQQLISGTSLAARTRYLS
jgi:hypothetical protein